MCLVNQHLSTQRASTGTTTTRTERYIVYTVAIEIIALQIKGLAASGGVLFVSLSGYFKIII